MAFGTTPALYLSHFILDAGESPEILPGGLLEFTLDSGNEHDHSSAEDEADSKWMPSSLLSMLDVSLFSLGKRACCSHHTDFAVDAALRLCLCSRVISCQPFRGTFQIQCDFVLFALVLPVSSSSRTTIPIYTRAP
jgi:hypothetical protein